MNLRRIERALERAFEGAFERVVPGGLHPLALLEALWSALEEGREQADGETRVPNRLVAEVSLRDYTALAGLALYGPDGLEATLRGRAEERGWRCGVGPLIALKADQDAREGSVRVIARLDTQPVPAYLLVDSGPVAGAEMALRPGAILGRRPDCDLRLVDDAVSSRHCRFDWTADGYRVVDLNSTNGTFVNEVRIAEYLLQDGQMVGVGRSRLRFSYDLAAVRRGMTEG